MVVSSRTKGALKSERLVRWLLYPTFLLGLIVVTFSGIISFYAFYPYKTIQVFNAPVPILNDIPVRPGESVYYELHFCKYTNTFATVSRQLQGNGISLTQGIQRSDSPATLVGDDKTKPCSKDNSVTRIAGPFTVPENIPAGKYHLKVIYEYQVNVFRTIPYVFETQDFMIERKPKTPDNRPPYIPKLKEETQKTGVSLLPPPAPTKMVLEPGETTNIEDTHGSVELQLNTLLDMPRTRLCVPLLGCMFKE